MRNEFLVWVYLLACATALESEVHEDVSEDLILLVEHVDLVADGALKFAILDGLTRHFGEAGEAVSTTELLAMPALEHVHLDHHAGGALEVLRELVQHILLIEICLY